MQPEALHFGEMETAFHQKVAMRKFMERLFVAIGKGVEAESTGGFWG